MDRTLRLSYRPPFEGRELIAFLAARAIPGIEEVDDGAYRRSLRLPHGGGTTTLRPADGQVEATFRLDDARDLDAAVERCRLLLDLDSDPHAIAAHLGKDPLIGPLARQAPGRRVPGHVDPHELAFRAVLGQQVSLGAARTLAGRLVQAFGEPLERPAGTVTHLFPTAVALETADLTAVGMPASRQRAIKALASSLASGDIDLDTRADREETQRRLLALPGLGPWTVSYIAMRALRDPDAFLATDLGIRKALELLGQNPSQAVELAESWRPYRAAASQHLWALLTKPRAASVEEAA